MGHSFSGLTAEKDGNNFSNYVLVIVAWMCTIPFVFFHPVGVVFLCCLLVGGSIWWLNQWTSCWQRSSLPSVPGHSGLLTRPLRCSHTYHTEHRNRRWSKFKISQTRGVWRRFHPQLGQKIDYNHIQSLGLSEVPLRDGNQLAASTTWISIITASLSWLWAFSKTAAWNTYPKGKMVLQLCVFPII